MHLYLIPIDLELIGTASITDVTVQPTRVMNLTHTHTHTHTLTHTHDADVVYTKLIHHVLIGSHHEVNQHRYDKSMRGATGGATVAHVNAPGDNEARHRGAAVEPARPPGGTRPAARWNPPGRPPGGEAAPPGAFDRVEGCTRRTV